MLQGFSRQKRETVGSADRRAEDRDEVFLRTIVTAMGGKTAPAELVNISQTGFLIRTKESYRKLERLRLTLPTIGQLPAEVAWSLAGCAGCRFIYPIDLADYPGLISAITSAPANWLEQKG